MTQIAQYLGTGKRKTSVARVILRPGDGQTWINGRTLEEYFPRADAPDDRDGAAPGRRRRGHLRPARPRARRRHRRPGRRVRHGIARALVEADPELRVRSSARASSRATPASSSARRPDCARRASARSSQALAASTARRHDERAARPAEQPRVVDGPVAQARGRDGHGLPSARSTRSNPGPISVRVTVSRPARGAVVPVPKAFRRGRRLASCREGVEARMRAVLVLALEATSRPCAQTPA